jgi:hypothetical protein
MICPGAVQIPSVERLTVHLQKGIDGQTALVIGVQIKKEKTFFINM